MQTALRHHQAGRWADAIKAYRKAIKLNSSKAEPYNNLGLVLQQTRQFDQAITNYKAALRLKPNFVEASFNLANVLLMAERLPEAMLACQQAIKIKPDLAEAHFALGLAFKLTEQPDDAIGAYSEAIRLKPTVAEAHNNLALVLAEQGQLDEAIGEARLAIRLKPNVSDSYANLLYCLYHHADYDAPRILEETHQWARLCGPTASPPIRGRAKDKLRVGYISPFFCMCADAHFIVPLLTHHDRRRFELLCFSRTAKEDHQTERIKVACDCWIDMRGLNMEQSRRRVGEMRVDILVNISRPADGCLQIMANRLAPVQATWMTFASCTTGLKSIDYRISDPNIDPPGQDELCYTETTVRLPETGWCYDPLTEYPLVEELPALSNRFITFGSFNRLSKINDVMIAAWAEILRSIPTSRLHFLASPGNARNRISDRFRERGVAPERIIFVGRQSRFEYLKGYSAVDIALDSFPFSGHTTTMDSLWMGVPVVTLAGRTCVGRVAASALNNVGLSELIGDSPQKYVSIAIELQSDVAKLSRLRRELRERMRASPLGNAERFARNIEMAYETMAISKMGERLPSQTA